MLLRAGQGSLNVHGNDSWIVVMDAILAGGLRLWFGDGDRLKREPVKGGNRPRKIKSVVGIGGSGYQKYEAN